MFEGCWNNVAQYLAGEPWRDLGKRGPHSVHLIRYPFEHPLLDSEAGRRVKGNDRVAEGLGCGSSK